MDVVGRLWDLSTGAELRRFEGHSRPVNSAVFGPDGRVVLTASYDGTARLWDLSTGAELRRFEGHGSVVYSAVFGPDGRTVLTASADETARLWDMPTGAELRRFEGHGSVVYSAVFGPDGRTVLTASHDTTARLWDLSTGEVRLTLHPLPDGWAALLPDGTILRASESIWRYAHAFSDDGTQVVCPTSEELAAVTAPA